jgi:hypothetical protein
MIRYPNSMRPMQGPPPSPWPRTLSISDRSGRADAIRSGIAQAVSLALGPVRARMQGQDTAGTGGADFCRRRPTIPYDVF